MAYDETAAAWGLFNVHFAWLADQVAGAVFYLRQGTEETAFRALIARTFGPNLTDLEMELAKVPHNAAVQIGLEHCKRMSAISEWRNERIHARVEIDAAGNAFKLYSWRTRELLTMSAKEIREKTGRIAALISHLNSIVTSLQNELEFEKLIADLFAQVVTSKLG